MEVVVRGSEQNFELFRSKYSHNQPVHQIDREMVDPGQLKNKVLFDFDLEESPANLEDYMEESTLTVIGNVPKTCLAELAYIHGPVSCRLYGFNGLPGFFERDLMEMTCYRAEDRVHLESLCEELGITAEVVDDRVGMVTPRVVCMIINEAYFTVQEGTATREDIDLAMKLGTNYPYGPFEWKERISIQHVYELLEAMYEDTRDERYKVCPLLKQEYLRKSG